MKFKTIGISVVCYILNCFLCTLFMKNAVVANSERDSSSSNFTLVIQGYIIQIEELK